jgi:poly-gamma-glutamate synthesis protein (capsule biosynthesis protein)
MQVMERLQTQRIVHEEHENSASLVGALGTAETTSYYAPYFSDGPPSSERVASMFHVGDIMLDRSVKQQIDTHGESYLLEALAGREGRFFSGFDIGVANLEGPFADYRRETTKEIAFRFDPALIPMLEAFSFDVFNLANNHSLDMGRDGLEESKKHLRNAAMEYFGTQYGVGEESVLIKEIGGLRFGFVGFNDTNLPIRSKEAVELIESLEDRVDHTIVNIHWGQEYQVLASNARQQALAHAFVDAGADVVVGHHPHVVQEIEIYNDRPIFYSLGNFIFDQYWSAQTQVGFALGLVFHDTDRISVYVFPHHSKNSQVTLMEYRQAKELFVRTVDASRFGDYTIDNFSFTLNLAK